MQHLSELETVLINDIATETPSISFHFRLQE